MTGLLALAAICGYATAVVFALDYRREDVESTLRVTRVMKEAR